MKKMLTVVLFILINFLCRSQCVFKSNKMVIETSIDSFANLFIENNKSLLLRSKIGDNISSSKMIYDFIKKEFKINLYKQKIVQTNWICFDARDTSNRVVNLFIKEIIFLNKNDCEKVYKLMKLHKSSRYKSFIMNKFILLKKAKAIYMCSSETPSVKEIEIYFQLLTSTPLAQ